MHGSVTLQKCQTPQMIDYSLLDDFKASLADRYTAVELVDLLDLNVWQIIEMFEEEIVNLKLER